jgi:hypothetical protein
MPLWVSVLLASLSGGSMGLGIIDPDGIVSR